jgi:hypothetical protein
MNTDLKNQSFDSRFLLFKKLKETIYSDRYSIFMDERAADDFPIVDKILMPLQKRLLIFMDRVQKKVEISETGQSATVKPVEVYDLRMLDSVKLNAVATIALKDQPKIEPHQGKPGLLKASWPHHERDSFGFKLVLEPEKSAEGFFFGFLSLLEGLDLSSFSRCMECNKWLLKYGTRKHLFCSDVCRAVSGNKKKRARITAERKKKTEDIRYIRVGTKHDNPEEVNGNGDSN